jgi:hypothetical protein
MQASITIYWLASNPATKFRFLSLGAVAALEAIKNCSAIRNDEVAKSRIRNALNKLK